jgi:hypothetical protein
LRITPLQIKHTNTVWTDHHLLQDGQWNAAATVSTWAICHPLVCILDTTFSSSGLSFVAEYHSWDLVLARGASQKTGVLLCLCWARLPFLLLHVYLDDGHLFSLRNHLDLVRQLTRTTIATKADIENHFASGGGNRIAEVKLMTGFGFVEYQDAADASDAVDRKLFSIRPPKSARANTDLQALVCLLC